MILGYKDSDLPVVVTNYAVESGAGGRFVHHQALSPVPGRRAGVQTLVRVLQASDAVKARWTRNLGRLRGRSAGSLEKKSRDSEGAPRRLLLTSKAAFGASEK